MRESQGKYIYLHNPLAFGDYIRSVRCVKLEKTITEIAREMDISHSWLSKIENGHVKKVLFDTLERMSDSLGLDLDELISIANPGYGLENNYHTVVLASGDRELLERLLETIERVFRL